MKYKWHVQSAPTGRYRSFERRGFPSAEYEDRNMAAFIGSVEDWEYIPSQKQYKSLELRFADHSVTPWKWRKLVKRFSTIQEAKDAFARFIKNHPEFEPKKKVSGLPEHLGF